MAASNYEGKVCFSCSCEGLIYSFLIVDLEASSGCRLIEKSANLEIREKSLEDVRFCVTDPWLYVIGCEEDDDFNDKAGQVWMSRYDLSSSMMSSAAAAASTIEIGPSDLVRRRVGKMKHPKWNPGITASPDGRRVVVYSQTIECGDDEQELIFEKEDADFEVFDTESGHWTALPQLILHTPPSLGPTGFYIKPRNEEDWIEGMGGHFCNTSHPRYYFSHLEIGPTRFINQTTLHVTFRNGLMFTLNLDLPEQGWELFRDDHIRVLWDDFLIVEPDPLAVFTPCYTKLIKPHFEEHDFPLSSPTYPTRCNPPQFRVFLLKYVEHLECITCTVTHGVHQHTGYPFLICDVFKLSLVPGDHNYFRPLPYGSFKYLLKQYCSFFSVRDMVPFHKVP